MLDRNVAEDEEMRREQFDLIRILLTTDTKLGHRWDIWAGDAAEKCSLN